MVSIIGIIWAVIVAFVSLLIAFRFFPKYKMSWKEKFLIAVVTLAAFTATLLIEFAIGAAFGAFESAVTAGAPERPLFGSASFESGYDTVMSWMWGLLELGFGLIVALFAGMGMLKKAGMPENDALKLMGVWILVTAVLWTIVIWLR